VTASSPPVLAIVGPTASGKSAIAFELALRVAGELVSCDSRQLYRELDIGTAKPTRAERDAVPHHLVDVASPKERYSAMRWADEARAAITDIQQRGRRPIVVGGTGLYLRALRFGLADAPPSDEALRQALYDEEAHHPGLLHRRLEALDPPTAARLHPRDLVRVVRALEVWTLTGQPLSVHFAEQPRGERLPMQVFVLDPGERLGERIEARVQAMLAAGFVDEVRRARAVYGSEAPGLDSVGYREIAAHLDGRLTASELPLAITRATRRYARRQRTWFRAEPEAHHVTDRAALLGHLSRPGEGA
jgi:tRNA dimethylallyltransferase